MIKRITRSIRLDAMMRSYSTSASAAAASSSSSSSSSSLAVAPIKSPAGASLPSPPTPSPLTASAVAASASTPSTSTTSTPLPTVELSADDPIVQRLFQPWIPSDFEEETTTTTEGAGGKGSASGGVAFHQGGKKAEELRWLRQHAVLFGLDPERDLQLPGARSSSSSMPSAPPLDGRYAAQLEHAREIRRKKDQRQLEKELKQREQQLLKSSKKGRSAAAAAAAQAGHQDQDDQDQNDDDDQNTATATRKREYLPLSLRPRAERESYQEKKLTTIRDLMEDMDGRISAWKEDRRKVRRERKAANQHQLGGQQYPNQK